MTRHLTLFDKTIYLPTTYTPFDIILDGFEILNRKFFLLKSFDVIVILKYF
jgi:hypothetical protein